MVSASINSLQPAGQTVGQSLKMYDAAVAARCIVRKFVPKGTRWLAAEK
jgi:hypothetical protein